jgi:nucleotide-binding universal stress UspA family protein
MFKRVLLCYDGSEAGQRALQRGAELAIQLGADVFVLSIVPETVANAAVIAGSIGEACIVDDSPGYRRLLKESLAWLAARGVAAQGYLASGNTIDQIVAHAKRLAIDLIVLGPYPQPKGGFWWSSAAQRGSLTERAGCCVFVAVAEPKDAAKVS